MHSEYIERRKRTLQAIEPGVLVLFAAPLAIRNNDVEYAFRQDSDVHYLTGYDEPHCVVVLTSGADKPFSMFVRPRDPEREVWDGPRSGLLGAERDFGADRAFPIAELEAQLADLLKDQTRLYYRLGRDRKLDDVVLGAIDRARAKGKLGSSWPTQIIDPSTVLHEMRLFKSNDELDNMRRALAITHAAHVQAMAAAQPGKYEYEIEALLRATFRAHGSERTAYEPIVGSGANTTVLHYCKNDRRMQSGDLLLIDAGCEYGYYASDITRTFPVSGQFSTPQREIYEIVLAAQLASIAATKPGATLDDVHQASVHVITAGLIRLGIIEGPLDKAIEEQRYKPFFMHRTSHWLGMDVHDVGAYYVSGKPRPLAPGMVITVEPGFYIAENVKVADEYRGIGVRIEDDVLVTADGHLVMSASIPKHVEDVERACAAPA